LIVDGLDLHTDVNVINAGMTNLSTASRAGGRLSLLALMMCVFAIGTTEFVIVGILPEVAGDLGVSVSSAGLLVTGYALGVAFGGPVLTALTGRLPRKGLLLGLMGGFIAANALAALAPSYGVLLIARVLSALAHGTFFAVATVMASEAVSAEHRASAIAQVAIGLNLATVIGVPLGTLLGQHAGWRSTFWAVSALGVIGALGVLALVPRVGGGGQAGLRAELGVFRRRQVWLALAMTVLGFAGVYTSFTYLVPLLTDVTGFHNSAVTVLLFVFGAGSLIGTLAAGRLADRAPLRSLVAILSALAVVLAVFSVTSHDQVAAAVTVFGFGLAAFATVPVLQTQIITAAEGAPTVASAANIAAFNLGNAAGAALGGRVIAAGLGLPAINWVAALVTLLGLGVAIATLLADRRARTRPIDRRDGRCSEPCPTT